MNRSAIHLVVLMVMFQHAVEAMDFEEAIVNKAGMQYVTDQRRTEQ
jgi:hypothetical protein